MYRVSDFHGTPAGVAFVDKPAGLHEFFTKAVGRRYRHYYINTKHGTSPGLWRRASCYFSRCFSVFLSSVAPNTYSISRQNSARLVVRTLGCLKSRLHGLSGWVLTHNYGSSRQIEVHIEFLRPRGHSLLVYLSIELIVMARYCNTMVGTCDQARWSTLCAIWQLMNGTPSKLSTNAILNLFAQPATFLRKYSFYNGTYSKRPEKDYYNLSAC